MSKSDTPILVNTEEELREAIADTFEPHEHSRQAHGGDLKRHIDGMDMRKKFSMKSMRDVLDQKLRHNHPLATEPRAFIDAIIHLDDFDELLLEQGADLSEHADRYPEPRREVLEWLSENVDLARLNKGGTDAFIHGLPGSTKTTCMQYLVARVMEANYEDAVWAATPGRSEWVTQASWATVLWPSDVEKRLKVVPINPNIDPFYMDMGDLVRDVVEYDNPEDLMRIMRERPKGEYYVTYPDPKFRLCEYYTGLSYQNVWQAEDMEGITPLAHWWFAWAVARVEGEMNYWTSLFLDEADELLDEDAAKDQHDTYQKVKLFRNMFRDFRKMNLSLFLAAHRRDEVNLKVRKKLRWTLTMNQETMPDDAPVDGNYTEYMNPGEGMIWKKPKRASFSWPNMGRFYSVPAKFVVEYPGFDAEKRRTAGVGGGGETDA